MDVILGLNPNIFSFKLVLERVIQVTSEGDTLILNKSSTSIGFGDKMAKMEEKDCFLLPSLLNNQIQNVISIEMQKKCGWNSQVNWANHRTFQYNTKIYIC